MCGIVGIVGQFHRREMEEMLRRLRHRGTQPPSIRSFERFGALGYVRLPIIDVESGIQPLVNDLKAHGISLKLTGDPNARFTNDRFILIADIQLV